MSAPVRKLIAEARRVHKASGALVGVIGEWAGKPYCDECELPAPCSVEQLASRVETVLGIHYDIPDGDEPRRCAEDGAFWPCVTIRALNGDEAEGK